VLPPVRGAAPRPGGGRPPEPSRAPKGPGGRRGEGRGTGLPRAQEGGVPRRWGGRRRSRWRRLAHPFGPIAWGWRVLDPAVRTCRSPCLVRPDPPPRTRGRPEPSLGAPPESIPSVTHPLGHPEAPGHPSPARPRGGLMPSATNLRAAPGGSAGPAPPKGDGAGAPAACGPRPPSPPGRGAPRGPRPGGGARGGRGKGPRAPSPTPRATGGEAAALPTGTPGTPKGPGPVGEGGHDEVAFGVASPWSVPTRTWAVQRPVSPPPQARAPGPSPPGGGRTRAPRVRWNGGATRHPSRGRRPGRACWGIRPRAVRCKGRPRVQRACRRVRCARP